MRRWLSLLGGVAAVALTGMALAWAGSAPAPDEIQTEKTVTTEQTRTTRGEAFSPEQVVVKHIEHEETVKEEVGSETEPKEPVDREPPMLEILHPVKGQVFEQSEVVFEGNTEPGAVLTTGDKRVEVSENGSWRIVLHLEPGENLITFKAKDQAGNRRSASVAVVFELPEEPEPEKPRVEEPKKEEPKEEPKKEEPKEEEPKDHEAEWEFVAHQAYGECAENPPYDVFYGKGKPGSLVKILSEHGSGLVEVGEHGGWELKVIFEGAPVGEAFAVKVKDEFGNHQVFEFVHTG